MTKAKLKRARRFVKRGAWKAAAFRAQRVENAFTNHYAVCEFMISQTWRGRMK